MMLANDVKDILLLVNRYGNPTRCANQNFLFLLFLSSILSWLFLGSLRMIDAFFFVLLVTVR